MLSRIIMYFICQIVAKCAGSETNEVHRFKKYQGTVLNALL